jgi:hypothetical protein
MKSRDGADECCVGRAVELSDRDFDEEPEPTPGLPIGSSRAEGFVFGASPAPPLLGKPIKPILQHLASRLSVLLPFSRPSSGVFWMTLVIYSISKYGSVKPALSAS